jgi:hypothetical protein
MPATVYACTLSLFIRPINGFLSKVTALIIVHTSRQMGQSLEDRKDEACALIAPRRRFFF